MILKCQALRREIGEVSCGGCLHLIVSMEKFMEKEKEMTTNGHDKGLSESDKIMEDAKVDVIGRRKDERWLF